MVGRVAVLVLGVALQLVPIVVLVADDQIHQLVRLEEPQHAAAAHFMKPLVESFEILRHRLVQYEIDVKIDILLPKSEIQIKSNQAKDEW